jgi:death on curing protein
MTEEFLFLTVDEVIELHADQIDAHGGTHGIRDQGLLESAVATPQASFGGEYLHTTLWEMAAAYAFHIAESQPFLDGNKRAALEAALLFLRVNGFNVLDPDGQLYEAMMAVAAHELDKPGLAARLQRLAVSLAPPPPA